MNDVRQMLSRLRARQSRVQVSLLLRRFHDDLLGMLGPDTEAFFERVMVIAEREGSIH